MTHEVEFRIVPDEFVTETVRQIVACGVSEEVARELLADPEVATWEYRPSGDPSFLAKLEADRIPDAVQDCLPMELYRRT